MKKIVGEGGGVMELSVDDTIEFGSPPLPSPLCSSNEEEAWAWAWGSISHKFPVLLFCWSLMKINLVYLLLCRFYNSCQCELLSEWLCYRLFMWKRKRILIIFNWIFRSLIELWFRFKKFILWWIILGPYFVRASVPEVLCLKKVGITCICN